MNGDHIAGKAALVFASVDGFCRDNRDTEPPDAATRDLLIRAAADLEHGARLLAQTFDLKLPDTTEVLT